MTSPVYQFPSRDVIFLLDNSNLKGVSLRQELEECVEALRAEAEGGNDMNVQTNDGSKSKEANTNGKTNSHHDRTFRDTPFQRRAGALDNKLGRRQDGYLHVPVSHLPYLELLLSDLHKYEELATSTGTRNMMIQFLEEKELVELFSDKTSVLYNEKGKNIARLLRYIEEVERTIGTDQAPFVVPHVKTLRDLGENPDVEDTEDAIDLEDTVQVMTIHKAKGLEFEVVFLMGCTDEKMPGRFRRRELQVPSDLLQVPEMDRELHLQEERRLVYVAITRARGRMIFTSARFNGPHKRPHKKSRFIVEALGEGNDTSSAKKGTSPANGGSTSASSATDKSDMDGFRAPGSLQAVPPIQVVTTSEDELMTVSFSKLDSYERCPQRYFYQYVMKLPSKRTVPLVYGSALHAAVAVHAEQVRDGKGIDKDAIFSAYEDSWEEDVFTSEVESKQKYEDGVRLLEAFIERSNEEEDKTSLVIVEEKFTVDLPNLNASLIGYWDRIDRDEATGDLYIREFKTKLHPFAIRQVRENLQLKIYSLAFQNKYGKLPERVSLESITNGQKVAYNPTPEDTDAAVSWMEKSLSGIRNNNFTPSPSYMQCKLCPFSAVCDVAATKESF